MRSDYQFDSNDIYESESDRREETPKPYTRPPSLNSPARLMNHPSLSQQMELNNRRRRKRNWNEDEDALLRKIIKSNGAQKWGFIASHFGGRSGKQCRQRWHNHLREGVSKDEWSVQEYWILTLGVEAVGKKWSTIARYLPGRTDNTIKNQWNCKHKALKREFEPRIKKLLKRGNSSWNVSEKEIELLELIQKKRKPENCHYSSEHLINLNIILQQFNTLQQQIQNIRQPPQEEEEQEEWAERAIQGGELFLQPDFDRFSPFNI